jgi:ornithine decarboxylase
LSSARFKEQHTLWKNNLSGVLPYYAVKCNPEPVLLQWMRDSKISFDCASAREIELASGSISSNGFAPHILFANPCKTQSDIQTAKAKNINIVTADSVEELEKMKAEHYNPEVLLRIAVDDSASECPFNSKFGLQEDEVEAVARNANKLKIPVTGLSFHVGSGSSSPKAFYDAVCTAKKIWSTLREKGEVKQFKILDIGGGWSPLHHLFVSQALWAKKGMAQGIQPFHYIAEPGRYFAAPTHNLYTRVVGKKPRRGGGWRYTIDESIYGQFSCIPYDHATPRLARLCTGPSEATRRKTAATIFGRTCDSLDWIAESESMEELNVGDWLYAPSMGAYTSSTSTEFNGFPKPELFLTDEEPLETNVKWFDSVQFPLAKMMTTKPIKIERAEK